MPNIERRPQRPRAAPGWLAALLAVSSPDVAAANAAAVPVSGVPIEIAAAIRSGRSRVDISLDPAALGRRRAAADAGTVARHRDARHRGAEVGVEHRHEAELALVPAVRRAGGIGVSDAR